MIGLKNKQKRNDFIFCFSILIPVMVLFAIIRFIPIIETIVISFFKKNMIELNPLTWEPLLSY